jgi:hypothetical protein
MLSSPRRTAGWIVISLIGLAIAPLAFGQDSVGIHLLARRAPPYVPGARIRPVRTLLYAAQNDNARYRLMVFYGQPGSCGDALLTLGTDAIPNRSLGANEQNCTVSFVLTRALADRAAAALRIPRQDRSPLGEAITGTFAPSARRARRGAPVEVVLTIESPAATPTVGWERGGRSRGPRDNQFSLRIERNGQPVPPIEAQDLGGPFDYQPLSAGTTAEVRAPVAAWGDISRPGRYVVHCRYETSFVPDGIDPSDDTHRGAVWDRVFEGTIRFQVR